jgi:hypothetical protein
MTNTKWTTVDIGLLNHNLTKVIGMANVSFTTDDPKQYPKYITIEGHEFERSEDGIAKPITRYRHMKACNCGNGGR